MKKINNLFRDFILSQLNDCDKTNLDIYLLNGIEFLKELRKFNFNQLNEDDINELSKLIVSFLNKILAFSNFTNKEVDPTIIDIFLFAFISLFIENKTEQNRIGNILYDKILDNGSESMKELVDFQLEMNKREIFFLVFSIFFQSKNSKENFNIEIANTINELLNID